MGALLRNELAANWAGVHEWYYIPMTDDMPEEDKWLKARPEETQAITHKHEWEYFGIGCKRGDPTTGILDLFCKWCGRTKHVVYDQSQNNLRWDFEDNQDFRDK